MKSTGNKLADFSPMHIWIRLETVFHFVQNSKDAVKIVFLSNDHVLRAATKARLSKSNHFFAFESIKEFESYLQLTGEKLTSEFISKIVLRAANKFFDPDDESCLYLEAGIQERVARDFKLYFEDVSRSQSSDLYSLSLLSTTSDWKAIDAGKFWIQTPEFLKIDKPKTYIWKSTMTFVRSFNRQKTSVLLSGSGNVIEEKVLLLTFNITWSAKVKNDARFYELKVLAIDLPKNEFRVATETEKVRWSLNSEVKLAPTT